MPGSLQVERVDSIPETGNIRDFDELTEAVQQQFPRLVLEAEVGEGVSKSQSPIPLDSCDCEFIKFTDYYRIVR